METLAIIAVIYVFASAYTMGYARAGAVRRVKAGYRARRDKHKTGKGPAGLGSKLAACAVMTFIGAPLAAKGFTQGWRQGWPKSVEKVRARWDKNHQAQTQPAEVKDPPPTPTESAPEPPNPKADAQPQPQPTPAPQAEQPGPAPRLSIVPTIPAETKTPTKGTPDMAISTVTGGEVSNLETARAEAEAIRTEAIAALEDAQADAQRAKEDAARVETFASSVAQLGFGARLVQPAGAMSESAAEAKEAASKRAGAAEMRIAQADAFLKEIAAHEAIRDAASGTDGMAKREAYMS